MARGRRCQGSVVRISIFAHLTRNLLLRAPFGGFPGGLVGYGPSRRPRTLFVGKRHFVDPVASNGKGEVLMENVFVFGMGGRNLEVAGCCAGASAALEDTPKKCHRVRGLPCGYG